MSNDQGEYPRVIHVTNLAERYVFTEREHKLKPSNHDPKQFESRTVATETPATADNNWNAIPTLLASQETLANNERESPKNGIEALNFSHHDTAGNSIRVRKQQQSATTTIRNIFP